LWLREIPDEKVLEFTTPESSRTTAANAWHKNTGGFAVVADTALTNTVATLPRISKSADPAASDPWIFRDGRRTIPGANVLVAIKSDLGRGREGWIDALIRTGELEAALSDVNDRHRVLAAQATEFLAEAVVTGSISSSDAAASVLSRIVVSGMITVSPPEGFTYYALHPLDFSRAAAQLRLEAREYAIIGIRSIGSTLSAIVSAALKGMGAKCSRVTVRPTGHPYSRRTDFTQEQIEWIQRRQSERAQFLIVDEGPGRSGSTFLSVAEALVGQGISPGQITMIGSRQPDPESLCAQDAATRWQRFRFVATTPSVNSRFADCMYAGGGNWRGILLASHSEWPESWTQMERLKFISPDRKTFFKFEGMGRIGSDIHTRAVALRGAKFIPDFDWGDDGFAGYELVNGRRLQQADAEPDLLSHMARYCAFRFANFQAPDGTQSELRRMVEFNAEQEFGLDLKLPENAFQCVHPVIVDGRMQPWDWLVTTSGQFLKTDALDHGDNHFFPGPCDIAWDIAGIAVEWRLGSGSLNFLIKEFRKLSGVDVSSYVHNYLLAYTILRASFCRMAGTTMRGTDEEARLLSAYAQYRARAANLLGVSSGLEGELSKHEAA
jgi:hypothetical protein